MRARVLALLALGCCLGVFAEAHASPRLASLVRSKGGTSVVKTELVLPRAGAHLRTLRHWAGTLWVRARVSLVSTFPERAWVRLLTWLRQARRRVAVRLVQLAEKYDLNFEYAEQWLEDDHQIVNERSNGATEIKARPSNGDKAAAKRRSATENLSSLERTKEMASNVVIGHVGFSKQGDPVVLVDIKGTWEPHMGSVLNNTLYNTFERHEEVCAIVHVPSINSLSNFPTTTINEIVQGVLHHHPGKQLNAFITPNPGRALAWAFARTHPKLPGLQLKFVHTRELEALIEPHVLPQSLRLVAG